MSNEYFKEKSDPDLAIYEQVKEVRYLCTACKKQQRIFLIYFGIQDGDKGQKTICLEKVGQTPAWSIGMDQNLEQMLGAHSDCYKKGLICESQGYGIGAYAYFRRITEDIIDELLDSISDLLEGDEKLLYAQALIKTKNTRITQDKIDLVKDLLPVSLRPDGLNPLEALHSALSEGLHAEDDDSCLEYADAIKKVLIYLVNQVMQKKEDSRVFTEGMRKLLEKRVKAGLVKEAAVQTTKDVPEASV